MPKSITRDNPYSTAYNLYGDPYKLVEFRMMVLNHCSMDCKGCFYKRDNNNFDDFHSARKLAEDMAENGYKLETCYLLPTDIFDNPDNYKLFDDEDFKKTVGYFSYIGVASTLENGYDEKFFDIVYSLSTETKIELQVNILIKHLFNEQYQQMLKDTIFEISDRYKDRIVINLALNTGFDISDKEFDCLRKMITELSEDGIAELNFTFLYNKDISYEKKKMMLRNAIATANKFGAEYKKDESFTRQFNDRTFIRKPSFVFAGDPNRIYANPIVPFDEYVYIDKERYVLPEPSFQGFLISYGEMSKINNTIIPECDSCKFLSQCMGKFYFVIANEFDLGCFLKIENKGKEKWQHRVPILLNKV